jgi:hypothetical protein
LLPETRQLLSDIDMYSHNWRPCFRRTFSDWDVLDVNIISLEQAIYFLARPAAKKRIDYILEFIWRIAELPTIKTKDRNKLMDFVKKEVRPVHHLRDLEKEISIGKLGKGRSRVHLMIEILEPVDSTSDLTINSWLYKNENPHPLKALLSSIVCRIIGEAEESEHYDSADKLCVEFFLSAQHFPLSIEGWEHDNVPLGAKFPATLRLRERLMARTAKAKRWQRVFDEIQARMRLLVEPTIFWVPDDESDRQKLASRCAEEFGHTFLGFTEKQTDAASVKVGDFLQAALDYGIPYAFFPRREVGAGFKRAFYKQVNEMNDWEEFPISLVQMRRESIKNETHPASNVGLLWDDPRRKPPQTFIL